MDDRITPLEAVDEPAPSFPSVHATVAGAATTVLAWLYPDASDDGFAGIAEEAATSRLWAGAAFRSDIEAGLELGRAVGDLAVTHGEADGSDVEWDGSGWTTGLGYHERTPPDMPDPFAPLGSTWATWVLPSGDLFPEHAVELLSSAVEAAAQRGWAGIHYVIDDDVALTMGGQVGRMVVNRARGG